MAQHVFKAKDLNNLAVCAVDLTLNRKIGDLSKHIRMMSTCFTITEIVRIKHVSFSDYIFRQKSQEIG